MTRVTLLVLIVFGQFRLSQAELPEGTKRVDFFGYEDCVALENDVARVVLCHQAGGRVLEYSLNGENVIYLNPNDAGASGTNGSGMTGGRFDIGPEHIIPRRNILWAGPWEAEITGPYSARLTSQFDPETGVRLTRDFTLSPDSTELEVVQTIHNESDEQKPWCHWSRTFAVGRGIVLLPLEGISKYPNSYVMGEGRGLLHFRPEEPTITIRESYLEITGPPQFAKLGMDSTAGWFTYLSPNNLLFTKRFRVDPDDVYNEVAGLTTSIWYPDNEMVELEPIGPRQLTSPGESASYTEVWYLDEMDFVKPGEQVDIQQVEERVRAHGIEIAP